MKKILVLALLCFSLQGAQSSSSSISSSSICSNDEQLEQDGSSTVVMLPIIAALIAPEGKFMPNNLQWTGINISQRIFLKNIFSNQHELGYYTSQEIRAWASQDYNELNKIARENGFDIQLQPFSENEFGSLSILDVIITWLKKGTATLLHYENEDYKAVVQLKKNEIFNVYKLNDHIYEHPIAEIKTQSADKVYMTIADEKLSGFQLMKKISTLRDTLSYAHDHNHGVCTAVHYDQIIFPCLDINQEVDISWLKGMNSNGFSVNQALQQTKFKMDENGAHVQSAVMMSMMRSCGPSNIKILRIDKPFYIWIERENCILPVFAGYIDPVDWVKAD